MNTYLPFIYLIGWTDLNAWYVGVRFARGTTPLNLWTTYFTSSKVVAELRENYGEPDIVEVVATGSRTEVIELEELMIRSNRLHFDPSWLNRGCHRACDHKGRKRSDEFKAKVSASLTGIGKPAFTEQHRANIAKSAKNRKPPSAETRAAISEANKGKHNKKHTAETRAQMSLSAKNRPKRVQSEETKQKIAAGLRAANERRRMLASQD